MIVTIQESRITDDNADLVSEFLLDAADAADNLVVNMGAVEFMSSAGITAIVVTYRRIKDRNGHLVLSAITPGVENVLNATGLLGLVQTAPDTTAAIDRIRRHN